MGLLYFTFNGAHNVLVQALTVIIEPSLPLTVWQGVSQRGIVKKGAHLDTSQLHIKQV